MDKIIEVNPDFKTVCKDIDNPGISYYGRQDVSQVEVEEATALLSEDYKNIMDLQPGSQVIPDGYVNTKDGDVTANDILLDKVGYANGKKVVGLIRKYDTTSIFKDSYSDLSLETLTTDKGADNYLKIKNIVQPTSVGQNCLIESGKFALDVNIPQDILAIFLGITPEKIRFGETILGVRGTYKG